MSKGFGVTTLKSKFSVTFVQKLALYFWLNYFIIPTSIDYKYHSPSSYLIISSIISNEILKPKTHKIWSRDMISALVTTFLKVSVRIV